MHISMLVIILISGSCLPGFAGTDLPENNSINDSLKIEHLSKQLASHYRNRQLDSARITIDSIHRIAEQAGMRRKVADSYYNYSILARAKGNMDAFMENLAKSIKIYEEEQVLDMAARAYTAVAQEHVNQKNYYSALENFSRSLAHRTMIGDSTGMANNLTNLGGVCYYTGRMTDASEYYYKALLIAENLNNISLTATVLKNLGNIHTQLRNFDTALTHLNRALSIQQEAGNRSEESDVLLNLGIAFYESGHIDKAEEYLLASLQIKEELEKDLHEMIKVYNNLGLVAKEQNDNEKAIEYYSITLDLSRQTGDKQLEAVALNNLGARFMVQNNPDAIPYLLESLKISTKLGLKRVILSSYKNLQEYHGNNQNFELAYHYAQLFQELNDSLYNEESHARILELQSGYELMMKDKENELLRQAAEIHESEKQLSQKKESILRLRILFLVISVIAIAILAFFFIVLFNMKQKTLRQSKELFAKESELASMKLENMEKQNNHLEDMLFAEEEIRKLQQNSIDQKNHELTTSAMLLANKNEAFDKLRKLTRQLYDSVDEKTAAKVREMLEEIEKQADIEHQWDVFKSHFESIHKTFFNELRRLCGKLTQHDLQLCAYIRLNLSNKEISRLMNITHDSVNTHRYRLRKKLGLEAGSLLDEFIQSIGS
jgi:tetratricopeptide (TPR) repeat protein